MTPDERRLEIQREQSADHAAAQAKAEAAPEYPFFIPEFITVIHIRPPNGDQQMRVLDLDATLDDAREMAGEIAWNHPDVMAVAKRYRLVGEDEQ